MADVKTDNKKITELLTQFGEFPLCFPSFLCSIKAYIFSAIFTTVNPCPTENCSKYKKMY
jgi:hypothetical protein